MNSRIFFLRLRKIFFLLTSLKFAYIFLKYKVLPGIEHRPLFGLIEKEIYTIVDIGANKGQFALACLKWAPKARVLSFEPLSNPSKIYSNIFKNYNNFTIFNYAIGQKIITDYIFLSAKDDSSSFLKMQPLQLKFFPTTKIVGREEVRIAPLKKFLKVSDLTPYSLLKIDVQGFELESLKGCNIYLKNFSYIYCECSFFELYRNQPLASDVISLLQSKGFKLINIMNSDFDENGFMVQGDFLFKNIKNVFL